MPEMIRTLIISHTAERGGSENVLVSFLGGVKSFSPVVLLPDGDLAGDLRSAGTAIIRSRTLGKLNKESNPAWPLVFACRFVGSQFEITRHILSLRPDIVQANTFYAMIYSILPSLITRRPLVWHMHDFTGGKTGLSRLFCRAASRVIAVSEAVRSDIETLGCESDKVVTIYNSVKKPSERDGENSPAGPGAGTDSVPAAVRLSALRSRTGKVAGVMGSLEERKGFLEVIEAMKYCPGWSLAVAGGARSPSQRRYEASLRKYAEENGLGGRVEFMGRIDDTSSFFGGIDLFVHYPRHPDPLPTVILEAVAAGCPVVAGRNGGNSECLGEGSWGILVDPGDPRELGLTIDCIDPRPPVEGEMKRFFSFFSAEKKENAHISLYREMLGR